MKRTWWVLVLAVLLPLQAFAQETRGKILGTVQDAHGVVPGATVKITNVDTKTSVQLITNGQGYFEAPLLQPLFQECQREIELVQVFPAPDCKNQRGNRDSCRRIVESQTRIGNLPRS